MPANYPIPHIYEAEKLGPQIEALRDCAAVMTADGVATLDDHAKITTFLKDARGLVIDGERSAALALIRGAVSRLTLADERPPSRLVRAVRQAQVRKHHPDVVGHADAVRTRFISSRDDLKRLWIECQKRQGDVEYSDRSTVGRFTKPFAHFPAGTSLDDIFDWFKAEHDRFDAVTKNIVEIRTPGRFFPERHRFEGRSVLLAGDRVAVDGKDAPELVGKTIIGVRWISGKGSVETYGSIRLNGEINGVMMNTTNAFLRVEPDDCDPGHAPTP